MGRLEILVLLLFILIAELLLEVPDLLLFPELVLMIPFLLLLALTLGLLMVVDFMRVYRPWLPMKIVHVVLRLFFRVSRFWLSFCPRFLWHLFLNGFR